MVRLIASGYLQVGKTATDRAIRVNVASEIYPGGGAPLVEAGRTTPWSASFERGWSD